MKQFIKCFMCCCGCLFAFNLLNAQPVIKRVEYYIDNDPGYGNAVKVNIQSLADIKNQTVNINPNTFSEGVHLFGIRAKDANGAWSLDNKWLFIIQSGASKVPNIVKAEYYIDNDPGYGSATKINITQGTNLQNLQVNINPGKLSEGVHLFGIRAKDANGAWSLDNKWLFIIQSNASKVPNIIKAEYYIDNDPGYGSATKINITQGTNLQNLQVNINPKLLSEGVHLFGVRAKDANGAWSLDNKWLFIVQTPVATAPDLKQVEFYIDDDPGYGKAMPVAINSAKTLSNFQLPVNVSALKAGVHVLYIRSKDANGAWSLDNRDSFNIPTVINPATILINSVISTIACAGGNVKVSYQANGKYNADNVFSIQLSNKNGSFANAVVIGTHAGKGDAIVNCAIPVNTPAGSKYRLRVVSTSPAITGALNDSAITIKAAPAKPVISSVPANTKNLCPGANVQLTSSDVNNILWNTGAATKSITVDSMGSYYVTATNTSGCSNTSDTTIVSYSACAKPSSLNTINITSTSATILWKNITCATKYKVQYRKGSTGTFTTVTTADTLYVLSGLSPSSNYQWKVQTVCSANSVSAYTSLVSFTTAASLVNAFAENEINRSINALDAIIVPNPAGSEAMVYIETKNNKDVSVFLSDAAGKLLWSKEHTFSNKIKLPAGSISNGVYFVTVISGAQKKTLRFVKQQ